MNLNNKDAGFKVELSLSEESGEFCPKKCSLSGSCVSNVCHCEEGRTGAACEIAIVSPQEEALTEIIQPWSFKVVKVKSSEYTSSSILEVTAATQNNSEFNELQVLTSMNTPPASKVLKTQSIKKDEPLNIEPWLDYEIYYIEDEVSTVLLSKQFISYPLAIFNPNSKDVQIMTKINNSSIITNFGIQFVLVLIFILFLIAVILIVFGCCLRKCLPEKNKMLTPEQLATYFPKVAEEKVLRNYGDKKCPCCGVWLYTDSCNYIKQTDTIVHTGCMIIWIFHKKMFCPRTQKVLILSNASLNENQTQLKLSQVVPKVNKPVRVRKTSISKAEDQTIRTMRRRLRLSKNDSTSTLQNQQDGVTINQNASPIGRKRFSRVSRLASIESSQYFSDANRDNLASLNSPMKSPQKRLSRRAFNRVRMSGVALSPNLRRIRMSKRFNAWPEKEVLGEVNNIKKRASFPNNGRELPQVDGPYKIEQKGNSEPTLLVSSNIM